MNTIKFCLTIVKELIPLLGYAESGPFNILLTFDRMVRL